MKWLPILIRLARRRADDRRIALAEAERQSSIAADAMAEHQQATSRETERARGKPEEMRLWSDWSRVAAGDSQRLALATDMLLRQEEALRALLRDDFADIKRLEIALAAFEQSARRQALRKTEQAAEEAELRRPRLDEALTDRKRWSPGNSFPRLAKAVPDPAFP
jgi:Ni/Co efflux regulator RcnB